MATPYVPVGLPPLPAGAIPGSLPFGAAPPAILPYGAPLGFGTQQQQRLKKPQLHPTVVVLTRVPSFLSHSRNLRDWVYSVGAHAKSISYSRDNRSNAYYNASTLLYLKHKKNASSSSSSSFTTTSDDASKYNNTVAVIRMSHSTGAYHVCRLWEQAKRRLLQNVQTEESDVVSEMDAYLLVTTSNDQYVCADPLSKEHDREYLDTFVFPSMYGETLASAASFAPPPAASSLSMAVPPPPPGLPPGTGGTILIPSSFINPPVSAELSDVPQNTPSPQEVEESLVSRLVDACHTIRLKQESMDTLASSSTLAAVDSNPMLLSDNNLNSVSTDLDFKEVEDPSRLDVQKVAAAAGGGQYDEDMDPLNAPAVLEAVAKFKRTLEETSIIVKKKRLDYVDRKIQDFLGPARQRLEQRRQMEMEEEERKKKVAQEEQLRSMALAAGEKNYLFLCHECNTHVDKTIILMIPYFTVF